MDKLLKVEGLEKSYSGRRIVSDFNFSVNRGEIVGLLGPNGAGKTTAFYMVMGLIRPDHGEIFFNGENVTKQPIHKRAKLGMGYLAQEPSVFQDLTVEENILCILETMPLSVVDREERLSQLLEELHLKKLAKKRAITLSGGERRRLEITRALATNPSLLLLDEPFANVDPLTISDVKVMIRHLASMGISILITDHNAREIFSVVENCSLMRDGKIFLSGSVDELIAHPEARRFYLGDDFKM